MGHDEEWMLYNNNSTWFSGFCCFTWTCGSSDPM